jgi:hypothetical protein
MRDTTYAASDLADLIGAEIARIRYSTSAGEDRGNARIPWGTPGPDRGPGVEQQASTPAPGFLSRHPRPGFGGARDTRNRPLVNRRPEPQTVRLASAAFSVAVIAGYAVAIMV